MSLKKYKIGILSTAYIAHNAIIRPTKKRHDTLLHAVASRDIDRAKSFAKKHDIKKYYGSYHELLEDKEIDIVYVCLPNAMHYEWSKKALLAKKHVLCEKVMVPGHAEADELINIAKEHNLMLADGMHYRYYPSCKELLALLHNSKETITAINARLGFPLPSYPNIRLQPECYGGAFMHLMCYLVDVLFTIFPNSWLDVESLSSKYFNTGADLWSEMKYLIAKGNVNGKLTASFLEDRVGSYLCVHTLEDTWTIKHFFDPTIIIGSDEIVDRIIQVIEIFKNGQRVITCDYGMTTYDYQLQTFIENINSGHPDPLKMVNSETCAFMGDCLNFLYKPDEVPDFHC